MSVAAVVSTHSSIGSIIPVAYAIGMNVVGLEHAARRVVPAHAALEAGDAAGVERRDGRYQSSSSPRSSANRRSLPSSRRSVSRRSRSAPNSSTRPFPACFASYIAASARASSASGVVSVATETATPMLIPIIASASRSAIVSDIASTMRCAIATASAAILDVLEQDHELVAAEARDGVVGTHETAAAGSATSVSTASPASCPNTSLTSLKPSRSQYSTANCSDVRALRSMQ